MTNIEPAAPHFADLGGDARVSFEFFPPKTEKMEAQLWSAIETLTPLGPQFVSVTYGAGGSTRERTHNTVARIARETPLAAAAHLTCVAASKAEIDEIADAYWEAGVRHIVALRGDPPEAGGRSSRGRGIDLLHPFQSAPGTPAVQPERPGRCHRTGSPAGPRWPASAPGQPGS